MDPNLIPDPSGKDAYPILGLSWLIMRRDCDDPSKVRVLCDLVRYCLTDGQKVTEQLGYIPFSEDAVKEIMTRIPSAE
jgi:phosphate transport system substrate-binding protein